MSLRTVSGGRVERTGFWIFTTYKFFTTKTKFFVMNGSAFRRASEYRDAVGATRIGEEGQRELWWTRSGLYWSDVGMSAEDVALLEWDRTRRSDSKLDRLRKIRAKDEDIEASRRERIPDDVRAFVWSRDDGSCVKCGAEDDLQFDHIIPVAKGGGSGVENIQILCGDCNRQKSDSIV